MLDPSTFSFDPSPLRLDPAADFIVRVPPGLGDRKALFDGLRRDLRLPEHFGDNWDALSDCLRDLSWIGQRRVVLLHGDLPPLRAKDIATYVEVLSDCVRDWRRSEEHELVVVFPAAARDAIASFAAEIPIGRVGRIAAGDDTGKFVRVVDDHDDSGGFLILVMSSADGRDGHDYWVENRAELARFFAASRWKIDWS